MHRFYPLGMGFCFVLLSLSLTIWAGDPAPSAPKTQAEVDQQLAELGRKQVELSFTLRDQIQKNETLWRNPQFTSPEIAKLRQRLEALEQETLNVQMALRELVAKLPEARAEVEKVEKGKATHQAIARQIEELKKQREQLP